MSEADIQQEYLVIEKSRKNPAAFAELYERYFARIFNYILRQTGEEELAADICSTVFLKALSNLKKFEFRGIPFSAWLYKIASNEVKKYYRKHNRVKVFSIEEHMVKDLVQDATDNGSEEKINRMLDYLKELPTEMLEVLELRFFESKDFKEIAYILDMTESGAKMRTYRALDKMRVKFNLTIKYDGKT
jgi:RNA polymerase sigma-70 factor, ECF subfamily